jgi:hypothetical protein
MLLEGELAMYSAYEKPIEQVKEEATQRVAWLVDRATSAVILWSSALVTFLSLPDNRLHHAWWAVCHYVESIGGTPM